MQFGVRVPPQQSIPDVVALVRKAEAAGFDAHCAKPLTPERLLRVLESAAALHAAGPP